MKRFATLMSVGLVATILAFPRAGSAAGLTVTPSAVSNTYAGNITLNITGLTNHEPVIVQTWIDMNNNSAIDPGEPLLDLFNISESGVTTIGGITNLNVPFDSNAATDTITTALSFALPIESSVGRKIYRVLSPSGRFTPVTATFDVTNAALNQGIAGTVLSGGVPQAGAMIVALAQPNFSFGGSAISDGSGNYYLKLPAGSYAVFPTKPGYFIDQSIAPIVTLTNGVTATNSLFLTNGAVTITGQVYDSATSNGLGGVFLQFESGNLFALAFSDTNGNYSAGVASNLWKIKTDGSRLARRAYAREQGSAAQADTTTGSASNVNFALFKGNAMFYGRITDGAGVPFANVSVGANDFSSALETEGFSDANGNYSVVALIDTNRFSSSGVWRASPNNDNAVLSSYISSSSTDIALTNNQAFRENFTLLPITARISGHLQNNHGVPISGISVGAYALINGTNFNTSYVNTDANGNFSLGAANGEWSVNANCCGNDGLNDQGYFDPYLQHSVDIPPTNQFVTITVYPIGTPFLSNPQRFSLNQFTFTLNGASGNNYTIQASTNLASTNWVTVMVISNLPGDYQFVVDNQATNKVRFYRALLGP